MPESHARIGAKHKGAGPCFQANGFGPSPFKEGTV